MKSKYSALALLILTSLSLSSCSHVPGIPCLVDCGGGGGNATVSFVLTATPPDPGKGLSIQAFTATITGITLTETSNASINVPLNATTYIADFNRVTSDSTLLAAAATFPAGSYTQMKVTFSAPRVTYCTQSNPGVPGCAAGTLQSVSGMAGSATITVNLSLAANEKTGIALNANLGNTLTLTGQTVTNVDLTAANVFTMATLPPSSTKTDLGSGQLSHIDDVLGTITAVNSNAITLQTTTRGSITATANSSTQFDTSCASPSVNGCVHVNDVAIIDSVLNVDGTFTLTFYQPLPLANAPGVLDLVEGVVIGVPGAVNGSFNVVVTDYVFNTNFSLLSGKLSLGDQFGVSALTPTPFTIISKGLSVPAGSDFNGATDVSVVRAGQTVAIPVFAIITLPTTPVITAATKTLALRFTRFSGTISNSASPAFSATSFPPYFGISTPQQILTTSGRLSLDGVSNLTSIPTGNTFSTTALYIGPPTSPQFSALSVRAH